MDKVSEFDAALLVKMSPDLLRWCTSYAPKKDKIKLSYTTKDGVYYYKKDELEKFNRYLNEPWPIPPRGHRPQIPSGIQKEIKKKHIMHVLYAIQILEK